MLIPKKFMLQTRWIFIVQMAARMLHKGAHGSYYPDGHVIALNKTRTDGQKTETFWHETTHAILHDMQHPLWRDEKFVTAFSKRLAQVVDTAVL